MTEQVYADHFESGCWHSEHHFTDLNYIGKFALNRLIQEKGFKVVLGGEGADEHFAGYPFFEADFFREVSLPYLISTNSAHLMEENLGSIDHG